MSFTVFIDKNPSVNYPKLSAIFAKKNYKKCQEEKDRYLL